jgi:YHS domain-containing protein
VLMTDATRNAAGQFLSSFEIEKRAAERFKNVRAPVELHALNLAHQRGTAGLPIDPVCRMAVDPERAPEHRTYEGTRYWFCSPECAEIFDHDPEHYATPNWP